jgi:hypothetical protein
MSLNPWLITWEIVNRSNPVPDNLIAAILPNQTGHKEVERIMQLLYNNEGGNIHDQVGFATRRHGFKVLRRGVTEKRELGSSPFLLARHVFNFEVRHDSNWDEIATWEDRDPIIDRAILEAGQPVTHFLKKKRTYRKSTNEITCDEAVREEYCFRKRRSRKV